MSDRKFKAGDVVQHTNGRTYVILGLVAYEPNDSLCYLYRDQAGDLWARPVEVMEDGRFVLLSRSEDSLVAGNDESATVYQRMVDLRNQLATTSSVLHQTNAKLMRMTTERDEADRRAGAAEREMEGLKADAAARSQWLSKAKRDWGVSDTVSFDVVWDSVLNARALLAETNRRHAERVTREPVAWSYEMATAVDAHGTYTGWTNTLVARCKPYAPEGSVRNLTPLYDDPSVERVGNVDEWLPLLEEVRQIREASEECDGDRRGLWEAVNKAEAHLIESLLENIPEQQK